MYQHLTDNMDGARHRAKTVFIFYLPRLLFVFRYHKKVDSEQKTRVLQYQEKLFTSNDFETYTGKNQFVTHGGADSQ